MSHAFRINPRRSRYLDLLLVFACAAPFLIFAFGAWHWEEWRGGVGFGTALVVTMAILVGFWVDRVHAESATLTVDEHGMRMESDLPKLLGPHAAWDIAWDEIGRVGVLDRFAVVQLQRKGMSLMPIPVRVMDWIEDAPGAVAPRSTKDFRQSTLWKAMERAGVLATAKADPRAEAVNFDLAKHPATRVVLVAMGVLGAYWALDSMLAREAWAEWKAAYILPHVVVGAIGAALGLFWLTRARSPSKVPAPVAVPLAAVLGLAAGCASYTGLVRVNQLAGGPLEQEAYVRNDKCDVLLPVKQGLPPIEYTGLAAGYWCQFPKDRKHVVPIRKGLFGLYQVDLTAHTEAIRDFRRKGK